MDLLDLFAKITIDTSGYEEGLDDASGKATSFGDKLKNGLANAAKIGAASLAAATAATTALTAAMVKGVSDTAAYGDNIDKMSQKMGLSAETYQEWDAIMQHSGTSIESLQAGMKTLANAVENGNGAFERLGITQEQIASMNNEELFSATITALQNVDNETERTYLAGQLLGRGATELGALLNTSAEDTEAMRQRVHELGGVMSDEAVKASAAFQDSLQDLQTGISGMSRGMLTDFLPAITQVMDGLTMLLTGDESGLDQISQGVDAFIGNLSQVVPRMFEVGGQLMGSLVQAIVSSAPSLISSETQIILEFVSSALSMLPEVISLGLEIISTLSDGISDALPELIPSAVAAVLQLVETLTNPDNLGNLLDAALALIMALADGLISSLPALLEKVPLIVANLVTTLVDNGPKMLDAALELIDKLAAGLWDGLVDVSAKVGGWLYDNIVTPIKERIEDFRAAGQQLLEGLWNGIADKVAWLKGKVTGVVDTIKSWFTGSEGFDEHSPSKWGEDVTNLVMAGFGNGFEKGLPSLMSNVDSVVSRVKSGMDFGTASVDFAASGVGISSAAVANSVIDSARSDGSGPITLNIMLPNGEKLASYFFDPLVNFAKANGTPILSPT